MKIAERIVMVLLLVVLISGGVWIYFTVQYKHQQKLEAVARGEYEIPLESDERPVAPEEWRKIYPNTIKIQIGEVPVLASVADTLNTRMKGLSDTPFLPDGVVKLFVFGTEGSHSIWMKDMKYALDIIWVDRAGQVVHFEEVVSPETYPDSFSSPVPAWYVIEANAGFVASSSLAIGQTVLLPEKYRY